MGSAMKRDISTSSNQVEDFQQGLISLTALQAAATQMRTRNRRYRVAIVSCDSTPPTKQAEARVLNYATAARR